MTQGEFIVENMAIKSVLGLRKDTTGGSVIVSMFLILPERLVLTGGFNLYGKLVKWGGAGALIACLSTGFANFRRGVGD